MGILTKGEYTVTNLEDGRGISKSESTYQKSTSGTVVPTGTWTTNIPNVAAGEYLWTRTLFTYTDNTTSSTYTVGRMGTNGNNGLGISNNNVHYQASSSGTTAPTGTWTATIPTVAANQYLWTRTTITYTDGSTSVSYSVGKMGADGKDAQLLYLTASSQIQAFDKDDRPKTTQAITISAKLQNASGTATFVAIPYIGNIAQTAITLGGTGNDRTLLPSQWTNTQWTTIAITATLGSLTDTISVIKVKDGATGPKGDIGNQGIPGEKGEDGRTPYTHWAYAWSADGKDRFTTVYPRENLQTGSNTEFILENESSNGSQKDLPFSILSDDIIGKKVILSVEVEGRNMINRTVSTSRIGYELFTTTTEGKNAWLGVWEIVNNISNLSAKRIESVIRVPTNLTPNRLLNGKLYIQVNGEYIRAAYPKFEVVEDDGTKSTIYTPAPSEDFANAYPTYAGTYTDYESTDSEDPTKYTWQRILGETGDKGEQGESASSYWITPSVNTIQISATKVINPTTITFTGYSKTGTANAGLYAGRFNILTSVDGIVYSSKYSSSANQSAYTYTVPADVKFIKAKMYQAGGFTALVDEVTIPIIESAEGLEIGGRNYFKGSEKEITASREFVNSPNWDMAPIFDTYGIDKFYTISFDLKSKVAGDIQIYAQNGAGSKYNIGTASVQATTAYQRFSITVKPTLQANSTETRALLAFYGVYDSGRIPTVKNVMIETGTKASAWVPALEDAQLYTAWSNDPNGKDMVRTYPNENLLDNPYATKGISWDTTASDAPADNYQIGNNSGYSYLLRMGMGSLNQILKADDVVTVSFDVKMTVGTRLQVYDNNDSQTYTIGSKTFTNIGTEKTRLSFSSKVVANGKGGKLWTLEFYNGNNGDKFSIENVKIEYGETATTYTPSPKIDPVKAEMAYIGYSPKDSNDPKDYVWSENPKAKGTFKRWANSPDGTVDFTAVYPNENLLRTTTSESTIVGVGQSNQTDARTNYTLLTTPFNTLWADMKVGDTFTFSCDVAIAGSGFAGQFRPQTASTIWLAIGSYYNVTKAETTRVSFTGTVTQSVIDTAAVTMIQIRYDNIPTTVSIKVSKPKLERGSVATPYTTSKEEDLLLQMPQYVGIGSKDTMNPADFVWNINPEYNQARTDLGLDSKVDDETFNDAQDHMNEVVDGKADAQELQDLKDMADNLQQSYEGFVGEGGQHEADLQALEARVEGLIFELDEQVAAFDFVKTHMRLGEEGFEIAEEGSTMKMLLTNNALSFIDGGKEVASFSNQKFIINQGAIVESLQVGSHKMSRLSDKVTVFQYAPKTTVTN